jgi:hypothetical protein
VLTFELLIVVAAFLAVAGLARASFLYRAEREADSASGTSQTRPLVGSDRRTQ